jgi:hypothetical protein
LHRLVLSRRRCERARVYDTPIVDLAYGGPDNEPRGAIEFAVIRKYFPKP